MAGLSGPERAGERDREFRSAGSRIPLARGVRNRGTHLKSVGAHGCGVEQGAVRGAVRGVVQGAVGTVRGGCGEQGARRGNGKRMGRRNATSVLADGGEVRETRRTVWRVE